MTTRPASNKRGRWSLFFVTPMKRLSAPSRLCTRFALCLLCYPVIMEVVLSYIYEASKDEEVHSSVTRNKTPAKASEGHIHRSCNPPERYMPVVGGRCTPLRSQHCALPAEPKMVALDKGSVSTRPHPFVCAVRTAGIRVFSHRPGTPKLGVAITASLSGAGWYCILPHVER